MASGDESIPSNVRDWKYRTGWMLSGLAILFLVMDSTMKLLALPVVLDAGAVATHMRAGDPLFSHVLFGVYLGVVVWAGIYLRDVNLRALIPIRKN